MIRLSSADTRTIPNPNIEDWVIRRTKQRNEHVLKIDDDKSMREVRNATPTDRKNHKTKRKVSLKEVKTIP